jgi:hypothetical protein
MVTQINLKFQDDFFKLAKNYANKKGYMSIQELVREALREKIFNDLEIRDEYKKVLQSKDANTFLSEEDSKKFHEEMKKKAGIK